MNAMLTLLPVSDIDVKTHILVHAASSNEKISYLDKLLGWKLCLKYCENEKKYSLLQESKSGIKYADVLTTFSSTALNECLKFSSSWPKQLNLAGIVAFWSVTSYGYLVVYFYVNTNKLVDNIEDSIVAINKMCQNHVPPIINKFLTFRRTKPMVMQDRFYEIHKFSKSSNNFRRFFDELEKATRKWEISENYEVRENFMNFHLMRYQKNTVKWMIERETRPEWIDLSECLECVPLVTPSNANSHKSLFYYPAFGLITETNIYQKISAPKGGILADEMGLGKTVEILSLIISHRKDEKIRIVQNKQTTSQPKNSISTQKHLNWPEYKATKNGSKLGRSAVVYTVTPEEMKNKKPGSCRECEICGDMCDLEKSGWKVEFEKGNEMFLCPGCMATKTPLEVKTTLIVLPESLVFQWYNEISKHCSESLKVKFYFGLNKNGYLHPLEIAKFDIILTTYSTLTNEMPFSDFKNESQTRLVRIRKFSPSSITHVKWWRLIGDESQLVEGSTSRAAQMCTKIESHHRWCMTGTPIVKCISDLGGLFRIIGFWPFNVEHFWKNDVVAEFHDMADQNQDLSNSRLLQIAGQVMRRNTKKMVEDELRIPKLTQIEKVVQFTKIEESQYNKEMEGLIKYVKDAIGNQKDETTLSSMYGKEKVLQSLGKLKETLISCGEHANFSKRKNANEQVISDPKHVIFRLIRAKKTEIREYLKDTVSSLLRIAEIRLLRKEMLETANRYDQVADVILMIQDLNKHFNQLMNIDQTILSDEESDAEDDEKTEPAQNKLKLLDINSRKRDRDLHNGKVPPRKVAKLEYQEEEVEEGEINEEEQRAKEEMSRTRKDAMRPILLNSLLMVRFFISFGIEFDSPEADEKQDVIIGKICKHGDMMTATMKAIEKSWSFEQQSLTDAKAEKQEIFNEWAKKSDQNVGMKNVLLALENSYRTSKSTVLIEKIMSSEKTAPMLMDMSFWPVFHNSELHFKDGEQPYVAHERVKKHNNARCMGICNGQSYEKITRSYPKSTSPEVLQKMVNFIEKVEELRKELFNDYSELLKDIPYSSLLDCLKLTDTTTLYCTHEMGENTKMCIDESSRKSKKMKIKCRICSIFHTLAHLRFQIGTGSYHGQVKKETNKTIDSFFSMVFAIEKKIDTSFHGAKALSDFVEYIERLRQTATHIQSSCDSVIDYNKRVEELHLAQAPINVEQLRSIHKKTEDLPESQLTLHFAEYYDKRYNTRKDRMEAACQKLRHLIDIYVKEQNEERNMICGMTLAVKLDTTIRLMKEIIENDSKNNKILLFTTLEFGKPIWRFLTKVLETAKMPFVDVNRTDYGKRVSDFEFSADCKILLCSLSMCANGLNLTQANHIIFLDPTHLFSVVEQAIGRINRYGQKKEMKVYHMIVEGTIDEELRKIAKTTRNDGEQKKEKELTVGELRQIFGIN